MINLLPDNLKEATKFARFNSTIVQFLLLSALTVALMAGIMVFGYQIISTDEDKLSESISVREQELQSLISAEEEASELSTRIDTVCKILDREVQFSDLLKQVGGILPVGSVLKSVRLTGQELPVQVVALIDNKAIAAVVRQNLEDSDLFSAADLETIDPELDEEGNIIGYTANFVARPADDADSTTTCRRSAPKGGDQS